MKLRTISLKTNPRSPAKTKRRRPAPAAKRAKRPAARRAAARPRSWILEACRSTKRRGIQFFYWTGQDWSDNVRGRDRAKKFATSAAAMKAAPAAGKSLTDDGWLYVRAVQ